MKMMRNSKPEQSYRARRLIYALLSLAVIFHLFTVLILPNSGSIEGRAFSGWLTPYANTFAFNTPWVFFSPGPSPVFYLEYEYEIDNGDEIEISDTAVFPPHKTHRGYDDRYNRNLFSMRYFALNPERLEKFYVPWLCRQRQEATSIVIRAVFEPVTGIDQAWLGKSFDEMVQKVNLERRRFACYDSSDLNTSDRTSDSNPLSDSIGSME